MSGWDDSQYRAADAVRDGYLSVEEARGDAAANGWGEHIVRWISDEFQCLGCHQQSTLDRWDSDDGYLRCPVCGRKARQSLVSLQLYTFGLVYVHDGDEYVEELDVRAASHTAAVAAARQLAEDDYEPGWVRMVELPAGGSGGLVTVLL